MDEGDAFEVAVGVLSWDSRLHERWYRVFGERQKEERRASRKEYDVRGERDVSPPQQKQRAPRRNGAVGWVLMLIPAFVLPVTRAPIYGMSNLTLSCLMSSQSSLVLTEGFSKVARERNELDAHVVSEVLLESVDGFSADQ